MVLSDLKLAIKHSIKKILHDNFVITLLFEKEIVPPMLKLACHMKQNSKTLAYLTSMVTKT